MKDSKRLTPEEARALARKYFYSGDAEMIDEEEEEVLEEYILTGNEDAASEPTPVPDKDGETPEPSKQLSRREYELQLLGRR